MPNSRAFARFKPATVRCVKRVEGVMSAEPGSASGLSSSSAFGGKGNPVLIGWKSPASTSAGTDIAAGVGSLHALACPSASASPVCSKDTRPRRRTNRRATYTPKFGLTISLADEIEEDGFVSTLNPHAQEYVPGMAYVPNPAKSSSCGAQQSSCGPCGPNADVESTPIEAAGKTLQFSDHPDVVHFPVEASARLNPLKKSRRAMAELRDLSEFGSLVSPIKAAEAPVGIGLKGPEAGEPGPIEVADQVVGLQKASPIEVADSASGVRVGELDAGAVTVDAGAATVTTPPVAQDGDKPTTSVLKESAQETGGPAPKPDIGAGIGNLLDDSDSDDSHDIAPPTPIVLPKDDEKPRCEEETNEERPHFLQGLCECLVDAAGLFRDTRACAEEHWEEVLEFSAIGGSVISACVVAKAAFHVTTLVTTSGVVVMLGKFQLATLVWHVGSFVAAVGTVIYGVGCAASIWGYAMASTRCDPGGAVFTGTQTSPFCANCCKDSEAIFRPKGKSDVQCKHFLMPARCEGCAYYPAVYGHVLKTLWVSAEAKTAIEEYGQLNKARNRSIHQSLTITLAHSGEWDPKNDWMLFHLEHINNLERKYSLFWHDKLEYRMATPWHTEGEFTGTITERPALKRMRQLWSWVEDHQGQLPQQTIVGGDMPRAEELMGKKDDPATAARTREVFHPKSSTYIGVLDAERCKAIQGVDKLDTAVVAKPNAIKIGPILGVPQIHSHGDTLTKVAVAEKRTKPNKEYQPQSSTAQRLRRFWHLLDKNHFTTSNMKRAYTELFGEHSLEEILRKKFSEKQIKEAMDSMEISDSYGRDISKRKANVKFEVTPKPGKPPRGVIDNGIELLALNVVAGHLFEYLIMNKGVEVATVEVDGKPNQRRRVKPRGFLHANNIKGEAREHVLDRLLKEYAQATKEETCCFEVDQTGMEIHERYNKFTGGLLHGPYKILQKIHEFLMRRHEARLSHLHHAKIYFDAQHGMRYKFVLGGKNGYNLTAKFPDLPMDSGWLLTSVVNAINEFAATFCCFCANPDELFTKCKNPQGFFELHIMKGDHHWTFTSVPLKQADGTYKSIKIIWKMKVEGDDGAGLTARILAQFENYKIIEANYAELGLDSKLKLIVDGRLEFIGVHMLVKDGKTDVSFPWSPAISRSMLKLGTLASNEITEQAMIARSLSLAYMFAGRVNALCMVFLYQAESRIEALKKKGIKDLTSKVQAYSAEQYAFDVETGTVLSLSELLNRTITKCQMVCPPVEVQCRMLTISYECDFNPFKAKDLASLQYVANNYVALKDEDEEAWLMLPHQMK